MQRDLETVINQVVNSVEKKKVLSLCKKILKKCSFKSANDVVNIYDLAIWLYVYGYYDKATAVCDILADYEFTGNHSIWASVDGTLCLKMRMIREGKIEGDYDALYAKVNEHRSPELYPNTLKWYQETVDASIKSDDEHHPNKISDTWRMAKLEHAIRYREGGQYPIPDEKLDSDIEELIEMLSHI